MDVVSAFLHTELEEQATFMFSVCAHFVQKKWANRKNSGMGP
jgi:hypothetical protein